jgi:prephenate dehydratase
MCEGHQDDPKVKKTLAAVQGHSEKMHVLGSFPVAPLTE